MIVVGAAAVIFLLIGLGLTSVAPSTEIAWVLSLLLLTVFLFSFEIIPIDIAALTIMVMLGLSSILAPFMGLTEGLVDINLLFDGFSSNAVISIIAVMIIGAGLDKTGIMNIVARKMLKIGGTTEKRIVPMISGTVGVISGFMQNVGAAALFLPVVARISARSKVPMSRLLMPMGFCAILGGTLTMVGSSPLILLNDLIINANAALPADQQLETFGLFAVTPIGIALILSGILYFVLLGPFLLPTSKDMASDGATTEDYIKHTYGIDYVMSEAYVPSTSRLIGYELDDFETEYGIRIVAVTSGRKLRMGSGGLAPDLEVRAGDVLAMIGERDAVVSFSFHFGLDLRDELEAFSELLAPTYSGLAEIVISPTSTLVGESARTQRLRAAHGISTLAIIRSGKMYREGHDVRSVKFAPGDTVLTFADWSSLERFQSTYKIVVTSEHPHEEIRTNKVVHALVFFAIAMGLVLLTDLRLSVALLVGALGIIISGVLEPDEAYAAVSWKTVFLLASLIPLGRAVETSGAAAWIADQILTALGDIALWQLQLVIAVLATAFTLVMSNVGATVLLVPLAISIALQAGANPAVFALTVALATSNSFLLPTHQVNALIMGPGHYKVADFFRAGGIMTVIFLAVLMVMMQLFY
ncbi:MAG: SLC13 family permease [Marinosulfonomonas sp.]|nr:MAG: SLC13 family permease [Marinosulfonomonas sp.]